MNAKIVLGLIVVLVVLAGFAIANSVDDAPIQEAKTTGTCGAGGNCPYAKTGGCSAGNNCGLAGCGALSGGGCGCGAK
jgi:hypothetical protein